MRKIVVGAQVSMDGVMQAPGGPTEDPTGGFTFGGWVMPYFHPAFGEEIDRVLTKDRDLLLGRKTYEIFAAYWPYYDEPAAPPAASPRCSTASPNTWFRARATFIPGGRVRCSCAISPR